MDAAPHQAVQSPHDRAPPNDCLDRRLCGGAAGDLVELWLAGDGRPFGPGDLRAGEEPAGIASRGPRLHGLPGPVRRGGARRGRARRSCRRGTPGALFERRNVRPCPSPRGATPPAAAARAARRLIPLRFFADRPTPAPASLNLSSYRGHAMNKSRILVASLFAVAAMSAGAASADDYKLGALEIGHPWSRALPKGATVAAGYVKIKNTGTEPDRLVGGSTPVAGRFEIHQDSNDEEVMTN